jgi:hypothetical protein
MPRALAFLPLLACALSPAARADDELPPRAVARLGDHRFYHGREITCAALSHDGRRAASGGPSDRDPQAPHAVVDWDATTGAALGRWVLPDGDAACLAFSHDGSRLAVGGYNARREPNAVFVYGATTDSSTASSSFQMTCAFT